MSNIVLLLFLCMPFSKIDCQISLPKESCKISHESRDLVGSRVINGKNSSAEEAPWHTILERKRESSAYKISSFCGGNILSDTIILTAAHCVWGNEFKKHLCPVYTRNLTSARECHELPGGCPKGCLRERPEDINVYVGVTNITQTDRFPLKVKSIIIHPKYTKTGSAKDYRMQGHDLAIIILQNKLQFNSKVRHVCLPRPQLTLRSGQNVIINGFGHTEIYLINWVSEPYNKTRQPAERLQRGLLQLESREDCIAHFDAYSNKTKGLIGGDQLCAYSEKTDSCKGDSGGGLIRFDSSMPLLVGTVSFGSWNCTGLPGVYTNVQTHVKWIQQISEVYRCKTKSVNTKGKKNAACIFPFTYKGATYNECPFHKKLNIFWCSTKVDSSGNHVSGQREWGTCGKHCPKRKTESAPAAPSAEHGDEGNGLIETRVRDITTAPKSVSIAGPEMVETGEIAEYNCTIGCCPFPDPIFTWQVTTHDGEKINMRYGVYENKDNSFLSRLSFEAEDRSQKIVNLTCTASNRAGSVSYTHQVYIQDNARFAETGDGWLFLESTVQSSAPSIAAPEADYTNCCAMCQAAAPDTTMYIFKKSNKRCYCRKSLPGVTPETKPHYNHVSYFCDGATDCDIGDTYENNCYLLVETPRDWLSAARDCMDRNGTIVNINDAATNAFIANNITNGVRAWIRTNEEVGTGGDGEIVASFVSGGNNISSTSSLSTSSLSTSAVLSTSSERRGVGKCIYINFKSGGKWNTDNCETKLPYVCEGQKMVPEDFLILGRGRDPFIKIPTIRYRKESKSCLELGGIHCQVGDKCCPLVQTPNGYICPTWC